MATSIEQLTDNQAQHALLYFFQEIPDRLWPGDKPSFSDMEVLSEEAAEEAEGQSKDMVHAIHGDDPALRGELCRTMLKGFNNDPEFQPFVEGAVYYCTQPRMAPVSMLIAGTIIAVLGIAKIPTKGATKVTTTASDGTVTVTETEASTNNMDQVAPILESIAKLLSEVPSIASLFQK